MSRAIDADKVEKWSWQEPKYSDSINDRTDLRDFLRSLPTLSPDDLRGVGKWETKHNRVAWWYECSCCHEKPLISNFGTMEKLSAYCPNCGAKMEMEVHE